MAAGHDLVNSEVGHPMANNAQAPTKTQPIVANHDEKIRPIFSPANMQTTQDRQASGQEWGRDGGYRFFDDLFIPPSGNMTIDAAVVQVARI